MTIIKEAGISRRVTLGPEGTVHPHEGQTPVEALIEKEMQRASKEGEKAGYKKAQEEAQALFSLLQTMTDKLLEQKKELLEHLKPEIIEFSIMIAERVIRKELSSPQNFAKFISQTIAAAGFDADQVTIFVSPKDKELLQGKESKQLRYSEDPLMRRGDCRIETKTGLLNCSIARQLDELREKVLQQVTWETS